MNKKKIAIIGGGAAGYFAAVNAAKSNPGAEINIFESSKQVLAKVLISGGGRCNVTNHTLDSNNLVKFYPRGAKELRGAFSRFAVSDTIEWFESRGVKLKVEADNRMFPVNDMSQTIIDCLTTEAKRLGVILHLNKKLTIIKYNHTAAEFILSFWDSSEVNVDRVILTTGGSKSSFDLAASLGHKIEDPVPSLFSFEIYDLRLLDLQGISFQNAKLKLICPNGKKYEQVGPVLITHWGLSGPATIKVSALAARDLFDSKYNAKLILNFLGDKSEEKIFQRLKEQKNLHNKRIIQSDCCLDLPKTYWVRILEVLKFNHRQTWQETSDKQLRLLAAQLTQAEFQITGKGKFKDEFVTCGGVSLKEVNFSTMESRISPGLFFAGEVLDIDGLTGGFNFQSAWTTGWIAGCNV